MNTLAVKQFSPPGPIRGVPNPILIEIEPIGDVCLLRFKGCLHPDASPDYLNAKMDEIKALACTKFLADFEGVASVGSTGLSFIVGLYRISGGRLVLVRTQPRVRKVLEITRLNTMIPIAGDIESGLAALRSDGPARAGR